MLDQFLPKCVLILTNQLPCGGCAAIYAAMPLALLFILGVANFAMHRAVLESGHPLLEKMGWLFSMRGGRISLLFEFAVLLGCMSMAGEGSIWLAGYALYTLSNAGSAWAILTGRI